MKRRDERIVQHYIEMPRVDPRLTEFNLTESSPGNKLLAMRWIQALVVPLLLVAVHATAQSTFVPVRGTVRDQSGANVPNALVTLTALNAAGRNSSDPWTVRTTIDGAFSFDKVAPGTYEIHVQQEGFTIATARVTVGNRSPRPVDIKLDIAALQQQITVAADANQVSIQSDDNRDVAALDRNALDNVPIFDQNYIATISRFLDASALGNGGATLIMNWTARGPFAPTAARYV